MKKARVHIAGPISCLTREKRKRYFKFYEQIAKICQQQGWHTFLPHRIMDPEAYPELTAREVYEAEIRDIRRADIIIAYVGEPAVGVGTELEVARSQNSVAILLYEKGAKVSKIARGNPAVVHEIVFKDFADALIQLEDACGKIEV
ncbi:nucleoside 2-deoxyribosyltransferase [Patescibacteria group bacterium]